MRKEIKKMVKKYGRDMFYSYGTDPKDPTKKKYEIHVYRITMTNESGDTIDLSWHQVLKRCDELGLTPVKTLLGPIRFNNRDLLEYSDKWTSNPSYENIDSKELLLELCDKLSDGVSTWDESHIRKGVTVRIEHEKLFTILKYKGFWFSLLEGHQKNNKDFVDIEEIS